MQKQMSFFSSNIFEKRVNEETLYLLWEEKQPCDFYSLENLDTFPEGCQNSRYSKQQCDCCASLFATLKK